MKVYHLEGEGGGGVECLLSIVDAMDFVTNN